MDPGIPLIGQMDRAKLMNKLDWKEWKVSKYSKIYAMFEDNIFGEPCKKPTGETLLSRVWTYVVNNDGKYIHALLQLVFSEG